LDTLQAAILLGKFDNFISYELAQRSKLANHYIELLNNVNSYLNKQVILPPFIESFNHSVFGQFTILVESRHDLVKHLDKIGIPTCIHYPIPLPSQPVFAGMEVPKNDYINAVYASEHVLSLPFHPYMQENMQHEVIGGLIEFYERIS
jgi:UDP-2-acetamido-2-deoxy-ribo-hexuluronate aminotransferase